MKKRRDTKQQNVKPECRLTYPLLFDYACHAGDLDKGLFELVRKHLAHCPACRKTAKDISSVVGILRTVSEADKNIPSRLSPERRRRIMQFLGKSRD
ncbi:MAG: hypothetical protein PHR77_08175 [Kiritimatiellae bacterium]|nr:hypothetical protein [Kiritimatiellia bacterium]MDD5519635.1 hypothetical protein [Kiritimatiellia bacterium]